MATPHVSGAFAVLKQQSPTANVDDILSILKSYGVPVNDTRNNITKPRIDLRNPPWIARYSPDDQWESKIAVDSYGNTYMTGFSSQGYTTIKYDPRGNQIWVQYFNGGDFSRPVDLALDSLGNVYVTGIVFTNTACTSTSCGDLHAATIKYDAGGNQSWLATRNGGLYEFPSGIVVDAADNVYITSTVCSDTSSWENNWGVGPGWIIGPPCHWSKNVTVKYDHQNGNQLAIVDYANGTYMTAHGIVSDELSNVYVAGYACASSDFYTPFTSCSNNNFIIIKYGSNLNQLWVKTYNSGGSMYGLKKIRLDSLGNVYATGSSCYSPN
jgi:hypothetical protein